MSVIMDTSDLLGVSNEDDVREDMAATTEPDASAKLEFHVQMRSWTLRDMELLIVEAAAQQLVGKIERPSDLAKAIEKRAREMLTEKADKRLDAITSEIIDMPVTPTFGNKAPVTMREMIGLYGREYLTQTVRSDGQPATGWDAKQTRIAHLVDRALDRKFKAEIERATSALVAALQAEIRAEHAKMIEAEKARIRAALAKEVGAK